MLTSISHDFALSILNRYHRLARIDIDGIAEDSLNTSAFEKILSPSFLLLPCLDWEVAWESYYSAFDSVALYLGYINSDDEEPPSDELVRTFDSTVESCIDEWNDGCLYPKEPTYHKILSHLPKWVIDLSNYYGFDIELPIDSWWGDNSPINRAIYDYNRRCFDGLVVEAGNEYPEGYRGEILEINERGNATLYLVSPDGATTELGSVV